MALPVNSNKKIVKTEVGTLRAAKRNKFLKKILYKSIAFAAAFACLVSSGASVRAAETDLAAQSWKKEIRAGEAAAEEEIIKILTAEDLVLLSKQCSLDQWSEGKTVILEADIDLTGSDFTSIPIFGGTFDGQGHTISGFSVKDSGDVRGLFRYIQKEGVVRELNVEGELAPEGHRSSLGGIAGSNSGKLTGCSFKGTVKGKNQIGGIAGINEATGQIIKCSFEGDISGEHYAGGIAGQNLGSIVRSKNEGTVNITEVKISAELSEIDLRNSLLNLNSVENAPACTDIGGIAGASSGIIQSCENYGDVGYEHVGYNIGGIAGRQSGYLDGCVNEGTVLGRKDVGGIAGQFEPDLMLKYNPDTLKSLWKELEVLQKLIDTTIKDAKGVSTSVSAGMQNLSDSAKNVKNATGELTDSMVDWADENLEKINDFSARISWAMDQMDPVTDSLTDAISLMGDAAGQLSKALKEGKIGMQLGAEMAGELSEALKQLQNAIDSAQKAVEHMKKAVEIFKGAIGDSDKMKEGLRKMADGCESLGKAFDDIAAALEKIHEKIKDIPALEKLDSTLVQLQGACEDFSAALKWLGEALKKVTVSDEGIAGAGQLVEAAEAVRTAGQQLRTAGRAAASALAAADAENTELLNAYETVQVNQNELERSLADILSMLDQDAADISAEKMKAAVETLLEKVLNIRRAFDDLEKLLGTDADAKALKNEIEDGREQLDRIEVMAKSLLEAVEQDGSILDESDKEETESSGQPSEEESGEKETPEDGSGEETPSEGESSEETPSEEESGGEMPSEGENGEETPSGDAGGETPSEGENGNEEPSKQPVREERGPEEVSDGANDGGQFFSKSRILTVGQNEEKREASEETSEEASEGEASEEAPSEEESEQPPKDEIKKSLEQILKEWKEAAKDIEDSVASLRSFIENMQDAMDKLEEAGMHAANMMGILSKASSTMKDSFKKLAEAASGIHSTLAELADQPAIQFVPLNGNITQQKDSLDAALSDMTGQMDQLNGVMSAASDVLLTDMEAINRQFGVIIGLLRESSEEEEEQLEDRFEDVSDENKAEDEAEGIVSGCHNAGNVRGDVNVAGIVGSMAIEYDFDPEDDLTKYGDKSLDFSWQTSAVMKACKNTGEITSKKNYAGGIVGRMDLGLVSGCESYGTVSSTGGSYVGGIAGASWAKIRDSWAKCSLSGRDYVGGIAGTGATITGCRTLIEVEEGSAYLGTIAGTMNEDGEIEGNIYVHPTLAAVDNISYANKAEPVTYEELFADSSVPDQFRQFELTFVADDEIVEVVEFQYGKGISKLPEIPAKEGYSAKWPDIDYSSLTFSRTLEAEYVPYESALALSGEVPSLLVDGSFSSDAVIEHFEEEVSFTDGSGKVHAGTAVTVKVEDPTLSEISYTIHYRLPDQGKKYHLWMKTQSGWEKAEYVTDGAYLLLDHDGEEITFMVEAYSMIWLIVLAAAAGILLLLAVILMKKSGFGKKKKES